MTKEQIDRIIKDFQILEDHAKKTAILLEEVDGEKYYTAKGIIGISIEGENIFVTCDDSSYGCYDEHTFRYPLHFLTLNSEELTEVILNQKKEREEFLETSKMIKEAEDLRIREEMDRMQYEILKKKFEK